LTQAPLVRPRNPGPPQTYVLGTAIELCATATFLPAAGAHRLRFTHSVSAGVRTVFFDGPVTSGVPLCLIRRATLPEGDHFVTAELHFLPHAPPGAPETSVDLLSQSLTYRVSYDQEPLTQPGPPQPVAPAPPDPADALLQQLLRAFGLIPSSGGT
jgi:hypothetical protein